MEQDVTTITNLGILFTLCLGFLFLILPRRYALVPLYISGCYMTLGQVIIVAGLHFTIYRILILIGLIRVFKNKEIYNVRLNSIDKALIIWIVVSSMMYIAQRGLAEAFSGRIGFAYGILGTYFILRATIWDVKDIINNVRILAIIIIPLAVLFVFEMETGKNLFSIFGDAKEFSEIRNGRIRCQGPFRHPILAGTFGATSLPFFVGLWFSTHRNRNVAASAILAATIIVIASASSGPFLAYISGVIGLVCWHIRSRMRLIRRGILVMLLALHAAMKAPVWFLMARMSDLVGGGGYHRATLIDAAIKHFSEWWLIGTKYTAHWMPTGITADPNMADLTNQFIVEGVNGGILSMCLFIWLIAKLFNVVGIDASKYTNRERFMIWSMGCVVFSHVISMFSITYFDQIIIFWCLIIAMIAALQQAKKGSSKVTGRSFKVKFAAP